MGFPSIVCPDSESLLQKFTGLSVALKLTSCERLAAGVDHVRKSGNTLFCVILDSDRPLEDLEFAEHHQGIPLAVRVPAVGSFRHLARHLDRLRSLNLRVYLTGDQADNLVALRILSSVGIHGCADFRRGRTDWEDLADLATYALLGQAPHATIEPFTFIAANYNSCKYLEWGRVTFDDPLHYLHLDEDGRVALSAAELAEHRFVAASPGEIDAPTAFPPIRERTWAWRPYFTGRHPCASCAGWRICLGKFSDSLSENAGCAEFFAEMIDLVHQHRALNVAPQERPIWQP